MISIDGTMLPNPTKYQVGMSDLDSSDTTRNEAGVLVRNRVRQGVTKIELSFTLQGRLAAEVLNLVTPDKVHVEYYDPRVFAPREIDAYVGDRSSNMEVFTPGMNIEDIWWNISFNLIEY